MPASVEKLYTSATTLRRLGAERPADHDRAAPRRRPTRDGVVHGDLYLRGGGDPTFDVLDSNRLAQQVADAGVDRGHAAASLGDESAFDTPPRRPVLGLPPHVRGRAALAR